MLSKRLILAASCGVALTLGVGFSGLAQTSTPKPQPPAGDAGQMKRLVYNVNHGNAKELAETLGKHFKNDAEFEPAPASSGNMLLISAKSNVYEEVLATLGKLDRRPELVAVEILLLDIMSKKGEDGKLEPGDVDEKELTGPADRVLANVKRLGQAGVLGKYAHLQTATLGGRSVTLNHGASTPYISNAIVTTGTTGKPISTNTVLFRDIGTQIVILPSVDTNNTVTLDMKLKSSRAAQSQVVLAKDVNSGQPIFATEFPVTDCQTKLNVKSGHAVLAQGVQTTSKTGGLRTLVVVIANVLP